MGLLIFIIFITCVYLLIKHVRSKIESARRWNDWQKRVNAFCAWRDAGNDPEGFALHYDGVIHPQYWLRPDERRPP